MNYTGYRPNLRERVAAFLRRAAMRIDPLPDYSVTPFRLLVEPYSRFGAVRIKLESNSNGVIDVRTLDARKEWRACAGDVLDIAYYAPGIPHP